MVAQSVALHEWPNHAFVGHEPWYMLRVYSCEATGTTTLVRPFWGDRPTGEFTLSRTQERLAKHLTIHLREKWRARSDDEIPDAYPPARSIYHLLHVLLEEMDHRVRYTDATTVVEYAMHRGSRRFVFESWTDNMFPGVRVYNIALSGHLLENRNGR